ncbi:MULTISPECIES: ABC transporter ATP-binding protein [Thalassobaculum]|uniref:Lipopolysaccharide transport system ATP-binding protein n=1 Tax=Thalassobaculum litoreum DSM 18839 TaxID=1123362 RepID=A0A8G2F359_9PROT|nr:MULTISPECIES: ABC transporter ATP-binding protein [Thalassobaculum]SDF77593.1 lipopolysaccharide transport system ATP-binding protein [Thalassobaculum litoreum DSM 18839]
MSSDATPSGTARRAAEPAIVIENVSKAFSIFKRPADRLLQMLSMGRGRYYDVFMALTNVSLTVNRGETVGIVGSNGSGKSTLLQVIAGLLQPNGGSVTVHGRPAALLELGAGFNPEFTGRENIYLNAAILGLTQEEIDARFDSIVEFSGLADFIDRAVNTYSSGMYVRLAFSIAVSVDPDILIVDEALAVGDEGFQRKCLARIEAMRDAGATILFVSHAMGMVTQLCDRAVLMDRGEVLIDGEPKEVASNYYRLTHAPGADRERIRTEILDRGHAVEAASAAGGGAKDVESGMDATFVSESRVEHGGNGATIQDPRIETVNGQRVNLLVRGRSYVLRYDVSFEGDCRKVRFATLFKTKTGVEVGGRATQRLADDLPSFTSGDRISVAFEFTCTLMPGTYFANTGVNGLVNGERDSLHRILDALMFQVLPDPDDSLVGIVDLGIIPSIDFDPSPAPGTEA